MNDIKPIRLFNIYGFTGMNYAGNVWDQNGLSPALLTMTGGNRQPLIMEEKMNNKPILFGNLLPDSGKIHQGDGVYSVDGIAVTITAQSANKGGHSCLYAEERLEDAMSDNVRIRKLTPTECYKLMGFDGEDCKKCSDGGISNSQLYKQAGNSIVVNVLEAIFTELGKTYDEFRSVS